MFFTWGDDILINSDAISHVEVYSHAVYVHMIGKERGLSRTFDTDEDAKEELNRLKILLAPGYNSIASDLE